MKQSRNADRADHTRKPDAASQGVRVPEEPAARRREIRLAFFIVLVLATLIALTPGPAGAPSLIGWDKLDHIAAFAALALLARGGWPGASRTVAAGGLFAYGVGIELIQGLALIGRTASFSDMVANALGIAAGLGLAWAAARFAPDVRR